MRIEERFDGCMFVAVLRETWIFIAVLCLFMFMGGKQGKFSSNSRPWWSVWKRQIVAD